MTKRLRRVVHDDLDTLFFGVFQFHGDALKYSRGRRAIT